MFAGSYGSACRTWCLVGLLSLFAAQPAPAADSQRFERGDLLYGSTLGSADSVTGWTMEGPGKVEFIDGWMHMFSPDEKMHHVYWNPRTFPDSFIAEWEAQNRNTEAGLCIVFFAAKGKHGEDIFAPTLAKRNGEFKYYTRGDISSYHISYYANTPRVPDRGHANLRKNTRFILAQEGEQGIPAASTQIHKIKLVKDAAHIVMFVDGRKIIDWTDDGKTYGAVHTDGKIGFRQMQWTRFRYRNFRVWGLAHTAANK